MPGSQGGGGGSQGGGKVRSVNLQCPIVTLLIQCPACATLQRQSNHTHRPVTIRQILEAYQPHPDAEFRIDEVEVEHVRRDEDRLSFSFFL